MSGKWNPEVWIDTGPCSTQVFEYVCGLSGHLLEVNPFNQPGVEAYKKNMFALLGKPGYEDMKAELEARL